MHIDALLSALAGGTDGPVEAESGGVLVRCPAHADGRPSLFVSLKPDGMALVHCRAGCDKTAVLKAAGLAESQLFGVKGMPTVAADPPAELSAAHVAALSVYIGAAAERFADSPAADYAFCRFGVTEDLARDLRLGFDAGDVAEGEPSVLMPARVADFRGRAFAAHPRLVVPFVDWDGMPRGLQGRDVGGSCPLRWQNLKSPRGSRWDATGVFRTASSYETVIVTEGPGDGLTAVGVGYTAVVVRGAGVARSERAAREIVDAAGDARVILAGDNDKGGREFNAALGAQLGALGKTPYVLVLPDARKDLSAWREADPALFPREFHTAVSDAELWEPPAVETPPDTPPGSGSAGSLDPMVGTDIENARRALVIVGPDTAHVDGVGFLTWNGRVWEPMSATRERAIGHRVADSLAKELAEMPRGDKDGSRDEQREAKEYDAAVRRTRRMHMDGGIRAALEHLRTITGRDVVEFDAHRNLLTFRNGTVDLRSGALRPHSRDDRLTKYVDLDYLPDADCPRWTQFLAEVFPTDPEMPDFMRRLVGYGITGETREHVFALLYGHGANGKSVFVNTLSEVFAGITGHVPQAAVAYQRSYDPGAPSPYLAALRGVRLAVLSELSDGLRLNEALLKQVTAGDQVTARELHKGPFTFTPSALMVMATNYKPDVRGQDDGFWRRTRLIPFLRAFTGRDRDPALPAKLLGEAEGIAAWAVRGAVEWYASGLSEPATVADAVAEYRQQSDLLDGFLPGVLVRDPDGTVLLKEAYTLFQDWRDDEQIEQVLKWGTRTLLRHLEARKVGAERSNAGKRLIGIRKARPDEQS